MTHFFLTHILIFMIDTVLVETPDHSFADIWHFIDDVVRILGSRYAVNIIGSFQMSSALLRYIMNDDGSPPRP